MKRKKPSLSTSTSLPPSFCKARPTPSTEEAPLLGRPLGAVDRVQAVEVGVAQLLQPPERARRRGQERRQRGGAQDRLRPPIIVWFSVTRATFEMLVCQPAKNAGVEMKLTRGMFSTSSVAARSAGRS